MLVDCTDTLASINIGTLGSFSNRTPTSLVLSHTTYTCAFKPGCLISHNWLHTPDCKVQNERNALACCAGRLTTSCPKEQVGGRNSQPHTPCQPGDQPTPPSPLPSWHHSAERRSQHGPPLTPQTHSDRPLWGLLPCKQGF